MEIIPRREGIVISHPAFSSATSLIMFCNILIPTMLMVSIIEPVSYQNSNFPTERFGTKFESNLSQFYGLMFTV